MTLLISVACKDDKKSIKRFYKKNHYSASFMGGDTCFVASENNDIVGAVIVSTLENNSSHPFLHALVIDKPIRGCGIASKLLIFAQQNFKTLTCFSDQSLQNLYVKNKFIMENKNALPRSLAERFCKYQNKTPNLRVFIYRAL